MVSLVRRGDLGGGWGTDETDPFVFLLAGRGQKVRGT